MLKGVGEQAPPLLSFLSLTIFFFFILLPLPPSFPPSFFLKSHFPFFSLSLSFPSLHRQISPDMLEFADILKQRMSVGQASSEVKGSTSVCSSAADVTTDLMLRAKSLQNSSPCQQGVHLPLV